MTSSRLPMARLASTGRALWSSALQRPQRCLDRFGSLTSSTLVPTLGHSRHFCSTNHLRPAVTSLSDDEEMMRDSVKLFAQEVLAPRVQHMDEAERLDPEVVAALFENGLM